MSIYPSGSENLENEDWKGECTELFTKQGSVKMTPETTFVLGLDMCIFGWGIPLVVMPVVAKEIQGRARASQP